MHVLRHSPNRSTAEQLKAFMTKHLLNLQVLTAVFRFIGAGVNDVDARMNSAFACLRQAHPGRQESENDSPYF